MRDLFEDMFRHEPIDPVAAARRGGRPTLRKRFYQEASVAPQAGGYALALDGKAVRTPARRALCAPLRGLGEALAGEWRAQGHMIDPATMPLTRLANAIVDGVADAAGPVADEVEQYLGCDLLFYRAEAPEGLVARQAQAWDPILAWASGAFGARFVLTAGLVHVAQPAGALAAAGAAVPRGADAAGIWRLGALHAVTTLTGSALIALALMRGALTAEGAWAAAHVDEDWNMDAWGRDEEALERRALRLAEMQAAAAVLEALRT